MQNLNIATGLKEYNINGKCSVLFNPTDPAFMERISAAFTLLDEQDTAYREQITNEEDPEKLFEIAKKMDEEMRKTIDSTLGAEVCKPVFGSLNTYAMADGLPLWANLLLSIFDEMDDALAKEKKASNPRLKKYTDKFKKAG